MVINVLVFVYSFVRHIEVGIYYGYINRPYVLLLRARATSQRVLPYFLLNWVYRLACCRAVRAFFVFF